MLNFCLTREAYFAIRGSLDSNSALTCPTTSYESLRIERLSAPTVSASSRPASWIRTLTSCWRRLSLNGLLVQSCPRLGRSIADRCLLLIFWKPHQRKGSTSPFRQGKYRAAGFLRGSQLRLAPSSKVSTCTGCHTHSTPLPNGPSFRTDPVYELCLRVADQLAPQWGEPGSTGKAFGRSFGGLKQLVRGGYIWSPHRSRTC